METRMDRGNYIAKRIQSQLRIWLFHLASLPLLYPQGIPCRSTLEIFQFMFASAIRIRARADGERDVLWGATIGGRHFESCYFLAVRGVG
jgi:hypothetical protein